MMQRISRRLIRKHPFFFYLRERLGFHRFQSLGRDEFFINSVGESFSINSILKQLMENGIAVIPSYYPKAWVDSVYEKVIALNREVENGSLAASENGDLFSSAVTWSKPLRKEGIIRIHNIDKTVKEAACFRDEELFRKIGSLYYGEPIFNLLTLSQYNETCLDGSRNYHIDSHLNQFKSFVYLNDVTKENGPHDYILGSNRITYQNMKHVHHAFLTGKTSITDSSAKSIGPHQNFPGPRGTVLLVDTRGIHQGATLESGHRVALVNYFYLERDKREMGIR